MPNLYEVPRYPYPSSNERAACWRSWERKGHGPGLAGQQHPHSSNTAYFHATSNGGNMSHCPHAARVPVCGDNHLLGPSCPPSEQRAGACATVLAHCSRHCRTGDVHCPPFTLAAGCCCDSLVVLPRLSCPRGEATAAIKHKRGPLEHTQGQAAGPTGHFTPPHPLVTSGATAGVRGTALCSLSLRAGR